jgi:hypothetical protein
MNIKTAPLPLLAALAVLGTSACLKSEAKTPAVMPALMVPTPPSRTIVPSPIELEEPVPPPPTPVNVTPPAPKPDSPPPVTRTTPPPVPPPSTPPATAAKEAPPVVTAAGTVKFKELEASVEKSLSEAEGLLDKVKPTQLTREALDQFNTARSHARMAREALGSNPVNIVYAQELTNKALTLARQLAK